ncbi:MAG: hypothetical protein HFACDABA_00803 [Anaerolineales bacterium]|nr:hypothetical protein [Anaerolineales bacterium]
MKIKGAPLILTFVWCIFMGITVGSIGIGSVVPSVNLISKPFVCPQGEMTLETQDYHPSPVEVVTTLTWYCVNLQNGQRTELGLFPMSLYAGSIYGLLLFAVIYGVIVYSRRFPSAAKSRKLSSTFENRGAAPPAHKTRAVNNTFEKMQELKKLRDAGLITEEEFERKRLEIINNF